MQLKLAFLQVRMGSTRLPGKALLRIGGKSLLARAIERLRAARVLDGIVVLTTPLPEDDVITREAERLGVPFHRGPTTDVLARFRETSDIFAPDVIVRATADNPLIDIGSVDRIVRALELGNFDYCMETHLPVGAATEALTRKTLEKVDGLSRTARHREHVTLYIKEHREQFRTAFLDAPLTLRRPALRLTVDTAEDFLFLESLIQKVQESDDPVPLSRYLPRSCSFSKAGI
jgi:spore coat polysaccharide biosynthesis protein SpsF